MNHLLSDPSMRVIEHELRALFLGDDARPTDNERQDRLIEAIGKAHATWRPSEWETFGVLALGLLIEFQAASHATAQALDAS